MDSKIEILLDKINIDKEHYQYFSDAKITRIVVNKKATLLNIYIDKTELLPIEILEELESKKMSLDENAKEINIIYNIENQSIETYLSYYPLLLKKLKDKLKVLEIYEDALRIEDDFLVFVVSNDVEKERIESCNPEIDRFYKFLGYNFNIDVVVRHEENILEEIKQELEESTMKMSVSIPVEKKETVKEDPQKEKKQYRREPKDENSVIGRGIKEDPIKIKTLIGEDNNVVIEAQVFGTDYFESSKTDFKIITLKVTDFSDSIYCKVFVRDDEEYTRLCKEFKVGNWYKIRGYTKNDQFAKELVLNARDMIKIERSEESIKDNAEVKRVELHCHTVMSQMDGVSNEEAIVKQAMKWGHKAIAITDHNGVQAFPHVFNLVTGHNKNLKEGEEPFKVIYGAELVMIDDSVNIVLRPNKEVMLDQTFVVFDFETTGFNAGGADSIIEVGAVKLRNGEIIEKYDELINPGRPLPQKIIDVTNITDDMLKDKDNEENAIKRFVEWFGDCPMVAHNAKFDVSFLEKAYKKYNLCTFTNPVIDTL